ncbi:hypothetical protein LEMLEM_LOCUS7566 [Lemmus lemmus]
MSRLSPTARPFQPDTATRASLFNLMKFNLPSLDPNTVVFLLFLMSFTHFLIEEFGCLASILYFSKNNFLFMRRTAKELGLQGCTQVGFLVLFIRPLLFPGSTETMTLAHLVRVMGPSVKK